MATADDAGARAARTSPRDGPADPGRRTVLAGVLLGAGAAASLVDLFVFHLALQWHHFYDRSTTAVAITSDGFLHAVAWTASVWGVFLLLDVRRRGPVPWDRWTGAVLAGAGGFQLFDGVVDHKLLRLHQVRYGVQDLWVYDAAWIGSAVLVLLAGLVVLRRSRPGRLRAARPAA